MLSDEEIYEQLAFESWWKEIEQVWRKTLPRVNLIETFKPTKKILRSRVNFLTDQLIVIQSSLKVLKQQHATAPQSDKYFIEHAITDVQKQIQVQLKAIQSARWLVDHAYDHDSRGLKEQDIQRAKATPIAEFLPHLKRIGNRLVGRCPLHEEKTPSFVVYQQNNSWYCFGSCAKGGDAIRLVELKERLPFIEAVKFILHI